MIPSEFLADPRRPYKFIYAFIFAGLTSASAIYSDTAWLTIVLAAFGAVGVYFVPNPVIEASEG